MNAIVLGHAIMTGGLFLWMVVVVLNHFMDLRGTLFAVASFMAMKSLDEEPVVNTPLKSRRITNPVLHRIALAIIVMLQALSAVLFGIATAAFLRGEPADGAAWALCAFWLFTGLWFLFLLGDTWFVAYIRQDGLQHTHLLLLLIGVAGLLHFSV